MPRPRSAAGSCVPPEPKSDQVISRSARIDAEAQVGHDPGPELAAEFESEEPEVALEPAMAVEPEVAVDPGMKVEPEPEEPEVVAVGSESESESEPEFESEFESESESEMETETETDAEIETTAVAIDRRAVAVGTVEVVPGAVAETAWIDLDYVLPY